MSFISRARRKKRQQLQPARELGWKTWREARLWQRRRRVEVVEVAAVEGVEVDCTSL